MRSRGRLPHWEGENAVYFVTFRLAGSLPESVRGRIEFERRDIVQRAGAMRRAISAAEEKRLAQLFRKKLESQLDAGAGACWLAQPGVAEIVVEALRHFDGQRYHLFAWCVMPNHVHAVFQPIAKNELAEIVHSWKSYSSKEANRKLRRAGEFWEREYFDHIVRNRQEFERIVRYVLANPEKAGLRAWPWVGSAVRAPGAVES
jgi:REP element-mobilizing transposase RayT